MRITVPQSVQYLAESDPSDPKTVWTLRPLTYRETYDALHAAGPRPNGSLRVHARIYTRPESLSTAGVSPEEAASRTAQWAKLLSERLAALTDEEQHCITEARRYLDDYSFAIASRGIVAIDGEQHSLGAIETILDNMRPMEVVSSVVAEIANKIHALGQGDDKKKEPSA